MNNQDGGVKVLSLFDGMACGMLAMKGAGIEVARYVAFEIDKYAVQTSAHNFPMIEHRGDVFAADFTEFYGFDFLVGGSPCTYWSIAQKNNRETEASGMGWELFSQYVRALHEAKPRYFVYENNKSMSNAIRESITSTFGFEPVCINSALVSAQNRQRLYWVGKREADGTYSKVDIQQPEDRGILLKDILDSGLCWLDKSYTVDSNYHKTLGQQGFDRQSGRRKMVAEPVAQPFGETNGKAYALTASYYKGQPAGKVLEKSQRTHVAEPVYVGELHGHNGKYRNGKQPSQQYRVYSADGKSVVCDTDSRKFYAIHVAEESSTALKAIPEIERKCGYVPEMFNAYNRAEITDKAPTLSTGSMVTSSCAVNRFENISAWAVPVEWDADGKPTRAVSGADGKAYPVYEVKGGFITIKDKAYPIKLPDGFYIIRKLTVNECKRLQTVPDWYESPVSDTQAYKMLGNGWTVQVIVHLLAACVNPVETTDILFCDSNGSYRFFEEDFLC